MGYSTTPGSVFNSLGKTFWTVTHGGVKFHVPGDEQPQQIQHIQTYL